MVIFNVFVILVVIILIFLYEWPKINKNDKRLKGAFVVLIMIGFFLTLLIIFFPQLPGPTDFLLKFFRLFPI